MPDGMSTGMRDLGEFIREQRRRAQLSLRKLSEQAGISNPYLSQIERGLRKPSADILQAIAKALRISAETLYLRAGILDSDSSGSDVVSAILKDNSITEGQKQTLIEIYHSLRIVSSRSSGSDESGRDEGGIGQMSHGEGLDGSELEHVTEKSRQTNGDVARREDGERFVAGEESGVDDGHEAAVRS
jgi:transcriptional regulator with XRE-family HTH domain